MPVISDGDVGGLVYSLQWESRVYSESKKILRLRRLRVLESLSLWPMPMQSLVICNPSWS